MIFVYRASDREIVLKSKKKLQSVALKDPFTVTAHLNPAGHDCNNLDITTVGSPGQGRPLH